MVFNNILELILIFFMFINKSILVSVSIILLVLWLGLFMWWGEDYEMDDYVGETEEYEESHEGEFRENAFSEYEEYIVYEEKVADESECTKYEEFIRERSVCMFECESEDECEEINSLIDEELNKLADEYTAFTNSHVNEEDHNNWFEKSMPNNVLAVYEVEQGEVLRLIEGEEDEEVRKVKSWFLKVSPNSFSDLFLGKLIFYEDANDDSGAFVELGEDNKKWNTYVNFDVLSEGEKEMVFTLVHEFAHILTSNYTEMAHLGNGDCETLKIEEGCTKETSYINNFNERFWRSELDEENAFVSNYAKTNIAEDIAESFAYFVLNKKNSLSNTVAGEKVLFFYDYKDLVVIRDEIRMVLKPYVRSRLR